MCYHLFSDCLVRVLQKEFMFFLIWMKSTSGKYVLFNNFDFLRCSVIIIILPNEEISDYEKLLVDK